MKKEMKTVETENVVDMFTGEKIPVGRDYVVVISDTKDYIFSAESFERMRENMDIYQCRDCGEWYFSTYISIGISIDEYDQKSYECVYDELCDYLGDVCSDCLEDDYTYCDGCNEYHRNRDMYEIRGLGDRCEHCKEINGSVRWCDDCETYFDSDEITAYDHGRDTVCGDCFRRHYVDTCHECGDAIHEDEEYLTEDGYYYCESCRSRIEDDVIEEEFEAPDETLPIRPYSYKPHPIFGYTLSENTARPLYMGFELEMGKATSSGVAEARGYLVGAGFGDENLIYLKSDASIPSYGFEMVSHPMTLGRHQELRSMFEPAFKKLVGYGLRSHNTGTEGCGLHVHVSRNYFRSEQRMAFLDYFLNFYQDKVIKIARRKSSWAKFHDGASIAKKCGKTDWGHYDAVNFGNPKTIEIRVFRGTLKYETFLATLEFVDAVCRYINTEFTVHSMLKREAWKCFIEYIQKHKDNYEELHKYLYEKQLLNE